MSNLIDPWTLVQSGRYQDALREYDERVRKGGPQAFAAINNRGLVFLADGRPREALAAFDAARDSPMGSSRSLLKCAQARWLVGDKDGALDQANQNLALVLEGSITHASTRGAAYDALFLYFVGVSIKDRRAIERAEAFLKDLLAKPFQTTTLVKALLEHVFAGASLESVLRESAGTAAMGAAAAKARSDVAICRSLASVLFYAATRRRAEADDSGSCHLLGTCKNLPNPLLSLDWYLAEYEFNAHCRK